MMLAEYVLRNFEIYSNNKGCQSEKEFMINICSQYVRDHERGKKIDNPTERKVIEKMIEYFKEREDYTRCSQLSKILN
jgi:hypothetical protein